MRVQNSDASNFKYSVFVVVIVVQYYCSIQSSVLRTNQDFHTQMWQEKSDLGTMNKNGFNSGPVLNVSRVSRAGFDSRPSTSRNRVISPYQGGLRNRYQKRRNAKPYAFTVAVCHGSILVYIYIYIYI